MTGIAARSYYLQSVDLNRTELPFSSTEWDQAIIQSLQKNKSYQLPGMTSILVSPTKQSPHLVRLCGLVEHASVDGCSHQIVGGCDCVNVTSEMKVELKWSLTSIRLQGFHTGGIVLNIMQHSSVLPLP